MAVQAVFVPVTEERGIRQAAVLAEEIWQEHYADILTPEQVRYMVDRFQSSQAIQAHLREGVQYRLIETGGLPQGYMAYQLQEGKLFLSKLYLRKGARGQGLARQAVAYLETPMETPITYRDSTFYQCRPLRYQEGMYGRKGLYYHTGSAYGFYGLLSYDPETGDGVVVFTNGAEGSTDAYGVSACRKSPAKAGLFRLQEVK